jgi:hypothetical protein
MDDKNHYAHLGQCKNLGYSGIFRHISHLKTVKGCLTVSGLPSSMTMHYACEVSAMGAGQYLHWVVAEDMLEIGAWQLRLGNVITMLILDRNPYESIIVFAFDLHVPIRLCKGLITNGKHASPRAFPSKSCIRLPTRLHPFRYIICNVEPDSSSRFRNS